MIADPKEDEKIAAGRTVEQFLADSTIAAALQRVEEKFLGEMRQSDGGPALVAAHAKLKALDAVLTELRVVKHAGEMAAHAKSRRTNR